MHLKEISKNRKEVFSQVFSDATEEENGSRVLEVVPAQVDLTQGFVPPAMWTIWTKT
jgi:hypothetical protein